MAEGEESPTDALDWRSGHNTPIEEWISRPHDVPDKRAYAIVVGGDSMEPMFTRGMHLIISPNVPVGDGDIAYVHLTSGERLVKRVRSAPAGYVLESANPAHGARFVSKADVEAVHRVAYARLVR